MKTLPELRQIHSLFKHIIYVRMHNRNISSWRIVETYNTCVNLGNIMGSTVEQ